MARTYEEILQSMLDEKATRTSLDQFDSPSQSSRWLNFFGVAATAIAIFEQILDLFKSDIETIRLQDKAGTLSWYRSKALEFQYDAGNPQAVEFIDFVPQYPVVDESLQVITQAAAIAVSEDINIKVAKGEYPNFTQLDTDELTALSTYFNGSNTGSVEGITFAGKRVVFTNKASDRLYIVADVYFDGQYTAAIAQANVEQALNDFLSSFTDESFDGRIFYQRVVDAIQGATGVTDVKIHDMYGRPNDTDFNDKILINRYYTTLAGHCVLEDTAGNTPSDSINYIAS